MMWPASCISQYSVYLQCHLQMSHPSFLSFHRECLSRARSWLLRAITLLIKFLIKPRFLCISPVKLGMMSLISNLNFLLDIYLIFRINLNQNLSSTLDPCYRGLECLLDMKFGKSNALGINSHFSWTKKTHFRLCSPLLKLFISV